MLTEHYQKIDAIDAQLAVLFEVRMLVTLLIARI